MTSAVFLSHGQMTEIPDMKPVGLTQTHGFFLYRISLEKTERIH